MNDHWGLQTGGGMNEHAGVRTSAGGGTKECRQV
jgi:hypothetical protein